MSVTNNLEYLMLDYQDPNPISSWDPAAGFDLQKVLSPKSVGRYLRCMEEDGACAYFESLDLPNPPYQGESDSESSLPPYPDLEALDEMVQSGEYDRQLEKLDQDSAEHQKLRELPPSRFVLIIEFLQKDKLLREFLRNVALNGLKDYDLIQDSLSDSLSKARPDETLRITAAWHDYNSKINKMEVESQNSGENPIPPSEWLHVSRDMAITLLPRWRELVERAPMRVAILGFISSVRQLILPVFAPKKAAAAAGATQEEEEAPLFEQFFYSFYKMKEYSRGVPAHHYFQLVEHVVFSQFGEEWQRLKVLDRKQPVKLSDLRQSLVDFLRKRRIDGIFGKLFGP